MSPKKILWGVCGIGNGHTFRQLPIVQHFASQGHQIVIFAYDASYSFFTRQFADCKNVRVEQVAVPFYVGCTNGLDFEATAKHPNNQQNFTVINGQAMTNASRAIGKPDLVISDYEPISAQYAYACNAPLVTIDQQSKYLIGDFPEPLNGQTYQDEIVRLRMFFPKTAKRIASSFFRVPVSAQAEESVTVVPPVLRDSVINLARNPETGKPSLLVYLTAQQPLKQSIEQMVAVFKSVGSASYHVFLPKSQSLPENTTSIQFYHHGDENFETVLAGCNGIVTTAGHTLLSEAMYLGIPVYAMPLDLYEQQMNAHVIAENGFGVSHPRLISEMLGTFVFGLGCFADNIANDRTALMRGIGQKAIIESLEKEFLFSKKNPLPAMSLQ